MLRLGLELNIDGEERVHDGFGGFELPVVDVLVGGYVEGVREAHAVWQTATHTAFCSYRSFYRWLRNNRCKIGDLGGMICDFKIAAVIE